MNLKKRTKVGVGLIRLSDSRQDNVKHGSLEQQENLIRQYIETLNNEKCSFVLSKIIREKHSAKSEKSDKRVSIKEIRKLVTDNEIDFVVVESQSRFTRDPFLFEELRKLFIKNNVFLYEVNTRKNLYENNIGNKLLTGMMALVNESESNTTKVRVKTNHRSAMVSNGKDPSPRPLLGLDIDRSRTGFYIRNEEEIKTLLEIANAFCRLQSFKEVSVLCKNNGWKTKRWITKEKNGEDGITISPKEKGGEDYTPAKIKSLLTNFKYRGENKFHDDINQFFEHSHRDEDDFVTWKYAHGAIFSKDLIHKIDEAILKASYKKSRLTITKEFPLLKDLLFDVDGRKYWSKSTNKGSYRLYTRQDDKKTGIPANVIEKLVVDRIKNYLSNSHSLHLMVEKHIKETQLNEAKVVEHLKILKQDANQLEEKIGKFAEKLEELVILGGESFAAEIKFLCSGKDKLISERDVKLKEIFELSEFKRDLQKDIDDKVIGRRIAKLMENFDKKSNIEKRLILTSLIDRIFIDLPTQTLSVVYDKNLLPHKLYKGGENICREMIMVGQTGLEPVTTRL